jgi:cytochrome c-type biogenesis protein CcmH/NrfG
MTTATLNPPRSRPVFGRVLLALALLLGLGTRLQGQPAAGAATRHDPALSAAETQLLAQAADLAKTDPLKAAQTLRAQTTTESSAVLPFTAAAYSLQAGGEEAAVADLDDALRRQPDFPRARINLAKLLLRLQRYREAAAHLRPLLRAADQDPVELGRLLGFALLSDGYAVAAEAAYRQALVWSPEDPELTLGLLKSLSDQGRAADLEPLARAQLLRQPAEARWWRLLANAASARGDTRQALVLLDCARRLGLADAEMLAGLGDLYAAQGLSAAAAEVYTATPDLPAPRLLRAADAMLAAARADQARRLLDTLAPRTAELPPPERLALHRLQARLALADGATDQAIADLKNVLAEDPLDGETLLLLGETLRETLPAAASEYYGRATTLKNCEVRALTGLARIEVAARRYDEALLRLQQALALNPDPRLQRYRDQVLEASQALER